jgi:hypothetical protein
MQVSLVALAPTTFASIIAYARTSPAISSNDDQTACGISGTRRLARQGMGMRIDISICAVPAAIALSSPATAAGERDRGDCSGNDPALMIRGCTQVIEDASEGDLNRALALYMRGLAYVARATTIGPSPITTKRSGSIPRMA